MAVFVAFDLVITGMSCAVCSGRVERALKKLPCIQSVQVNLATETVHLVLDDAEHLNVVVTAIEKAGYGIPTENIDLNISGMSCASCVARVEKGLLRLPEVLSVSVNLAMESIRIVAPIGVLAFDRVLLALEKLGYSVKPSEDVSRETSMLEEDLNNVSHETSHQYPAWFHNVSRETLKVFRSVLQHRDIVELCLSLGLALPLVLPMLLMPIGIHWMLSPNMQFFLATLVQFIFGARFYRGAWFAVRAGAGNMDVLVVLGTTAAYGLSVYHCFTATDVEPEPILYFEASAMVIALVRLGKWLESRAKKQTGQALHALRNLRPEYAHIEFIKNNNYIELIDKSIHSVRVGETLVVFPGERFPVDGVVLAGQSQADESMLTGESLPIHKTPGCFVTGGALNGSGRLRIRVLAVGQSSVLAKMIRLVADAQANKPPIQHLVDKVSEVFVPTVVILAGLTFLSYGIWGESWETAVLRAVAVLVIACPCALGLATPAAIMVGTGVAARRGILIKDAHIIERAKKISVVAFDKTGTLTVGKPQVVACVLTERGRELGFDVRMSVQCAAAIQSGSEHPLAKAILAYAQDQHCAMVPVAAGIQALPGAGVEAWVGGVYGEEKRHMLLLSHQAVQQRYSNGVVDADARELEVAGQTVSGLGCIDAQGQFNVLAWFGFGDTVKPEAAQAIAELRGLGIAVVMISGDNLGAATAVAAQLGLDVASGEVLANISPAEKAAAVKALQEKYPGGVAMVGDGINDAPALAVADVGIAMATGTDVAMQAAGVTLMRGDLHLVAQTIDISRRTLQKIKQNLFWAFFFNVLGIPAAAFGFLNPVLAGAAMALSSVSVVSNALLLGRWKNNRK